MKSLLNDETYFKESETEIDYSTFEIKKKEDNTLLIISDLGELQNFRKELKIKRILICLLFAFILIFQICFRIYISHVNLENSEKRLEEVF